jgi:pilus biogenesis lipoprotein CpaD
MISARKRVKAILTIAGALFLLAGCYYGPQKIAHVRMESTSHVVLFEKNKKQISKSEYESLDSFVRSVPVSAVSYVGLRADDADAVALRHAKQIKTYLVKQGVDHNTIHLEPSSGSDRDSILLTMQYSVAIPPEPCPDWSKSSGGTYNSTNGSNFGCAYYNDMAVQMANPADFEAAQGQAPVIDAERESGIVTKYRGAAGGAAPAAAAPSGGAR